MLLVDVTSERACRSNVAQKSARVEAVWPLGNVGIGMIRYDSKTPGTAYTEWVSSLKCAVAG